MKKQSKANEHEAIPEDMYREHILELYRSPSNFGLLKEFSHEATEYNTVCGDEITVQLKVDKSGKIIDAKFSGSGCVVSMVSSSMLTDKMKGMRIEEIMKMTSKDIMKILKMNITPARIKCALSPLEATKNALR